jgi:hypothetical protein
MATLSMLVDVVARLEGFEFSTVNQIAREIREAGLIKTGGRGNSAAQMSFTDAANLLIAVNTSSAVREAPRSVERYRALKHWSIDIRKPPRAFAVFGDAFEQLLEAVAHQALPKNFLRRVVPPEVVEAFAKKDVSLKLTFLKPYPEVGLSIARRAMYQPALNARFSPTEPRELRFHDSECDRSEETTIGLRTIEAVAKLIN